MFCFDYFSKTPGPASRLFHRNHAADGFHLQTSAAVSMIEHPDKAKDEQIDHALAGLLFGSIKTYQAILKQEPASHWLQMDRLVTMREQGKLDDFVSETRRKCAQDGEKNQDPDTRQARKPGMFPRDQRFSSSQPCFHAVRIL